METTVTDMVFLFTLYSKQRFMKEFFFTELQEHRCLLHKNFLFGLVTEFLAFLLFVSGWKSAHETFLLSLNVFSTKMGYN